MKTNRNPNFLIHRFLFCVELCLRFGLAIALWIFVHYSYGLQANIETNVRAKFVSRTEKFQGPCLDKNLQVSSINLPTVFDDCYSGFGKFVRVENFIIRVVC